MPCGARGRAGTPVLLGFTTRVGADVDPSAVVFASRVAGEDWFCFEQPDRDGSALAALGTVTRLTASGADRFKRIATRLAGARRRAPSPTRPTGRPAPGWWRWVASRSRPKVGMRRTGPASSPAI